MQPPLFGGRDWDDEDDESWEDDSSETGDTLVAIEQTSTSGNKALTATAEDAPIHRSASWEHA